MNNPSNSLRISFVTSLAFLIIGTQGFAQTTNNEEPSIRGKLHLDSIWNPVVYLSHISTFDDMYTMSNEMIIAEASVDSTGYFSFMPDYLPEKDQLFRLHLSKKGGPDASLIIGGKEENHLFISANKAANIYVQGTSNKPIFGKVNMGGYPPNRSLRIIDEIANYADSTHFNGSIMKREFVTKAIQEKLRFVADTSSHALVSLYALYQSNFESNYPLNAQFYENYLDKWEDEETQYFQDFRAQLPLTKISKKYTYILIGVAFFILGFIGNKMLVSRKKKVSDQLKQLSIQERKIFNMIKLGRSNKEISEEYNIGLSTVKSHVSSIYTKLSIKSRKEAMDFK